MEKDISTEQKIKEAARKVFLEKGYGLTRTRDIAEEAGINLALLNYYFRSKEKLFEIIMTESIQQMFSVLKGIINNKEMNLSMKIEMIVNRYIDGLIANPNLPIFVLSEMQTNPDQLMERAGIPKKLIVDSILYKQIQEQMDAKQIKDFIPLHIVLNIVSLSIFPVVAKHLVVNLHEMNDESYLQFINMRRKLVPQWIKMMLQMED